mmetsp:Transcript_104544/g.207602  ORF Transcript_104544/g.207602 Transcript_104544/m.207602 type:complete len:329 (+) Transcript_104544:75-1061(+)
MPPVELEEPEDTPVVKALKAIDDKYLAIERDYKREVNELIKKYNTRQQPFLEERKQKLSAGSGEGTPALKGFWLKAMQNHPAFEDTIQEWDEPVLEHLVDIERAQLDENDSSKGFRLVFKFSENPYFSNTELSKHYETEETNPWCAEVETKKVVANEIDWKPGKNVTIEKVVKKVKGGGAKKAKQKKEKEEARPSFFRDFFRQLEADMEPTEDMVEQAKSMCEFGDEDDDEDELDMDAIIETLMENDYEIGCALRDNIIPFAVRWYTGEARPEEDDVSEDDEEDDEDDVDDDEDDEEDDDDAKARGKAQKKKGGPGTNQGDNPECKQQ